MLALIETLRAADLSGLRVRLGVKFFLALATLAAAIVVVGVVGVIGTGRMAGETEGLYEETS